MSSDSASPPSPTYILAVTSTSLPITSALALPLTGLCLLRQHRSLASGDTSISPARSPHPPAPRASVAENLPLALILTGLVELNGGSKRALACVASGWVVLHALCEGVEVLGMKHAEKMRLARYYGTPGMLLGLAGWAAWIAGMRGL